MLQNLKARFLHVSCVLYWRNSKSCQFQSDCQVNISTCTVYRIKSTPYIPTSPWNFTLKTAWIFPQKDMQSQVEQKCISILTPSREEIIIGHFSVVMFIYKQSPGSDSICIWQMYFICRSMLKSQSFLKMPQELCQKELLYFLRKYDTHDNPPVKTKVKLAKVSYSTYGASTVKQGLMKPVSHCTSEVRSV